jgi:hypothetical protein
MTELKNGQKVKIKKEFNNSRIICPQRGTVGRVINQDINWINVCFWHPFTDSNGAEILADGTSGGNTVIRFKEDEIEAVNNDR